MGEAQTGQPQTDLEPIFEADFQLGSYGYRPKRTAHEAINRVAQAIVEEKTKIIDLDLRAYFDNVEHYLLLEKVAKRVQDNQVMRLLKMILQATGKKGVPQGGMISPLLRNLYLNEVDKMLEKAIETTRHKQFTAVQYARFADDQVILVDPIRGRAGSRRRYVNGCGAKPVLDASPDGPHNQIESKPAIEAEVVE